MTLKKSIEVFEVWESLCFHNDDGSDPDSHELLLAIRASLPILKKELDKRNKKREQNKED